mmetsp:Transcript_39103/g.84319  ORF Transcript_39103/g.84319 Transcript_39103/m.84319 type:complete len:465 (+) Transcript_39103:113-1507(+)
MRMTKEAIRLCLKRQELYDSPELNERLYLHHKKFMEIRNLEKFTQVKYLYLESNCLTKIDKLNAQKYLQSLHLQDNKLERIENLNGCLELKYLNVSNNLLSKIDDLSALQSLESLIVKQNELSKPDSIRNVIYMKRLNELDLSKNKINCSLDSILEVLAQCKSLKILSLAGNPMVKLNKYYRKLVISRCTKLIRLDDKRVCKEERRRCSAWGKVVLRGGSFDEAEEADRVELNNLRSEKSEANALRRSLHGFGSDDSSVCSDNSFKTISASAIQTIKKTFGLVDSRAPSSIISWSSRRLSQNDAKDAKSNRGTLKRELDQAMKKELDKVRGIVESQRKTIAGLQTQLGEKQSKKVAELQQHIESSIHGMGSTCEDSERDHSYSFVQNQQLAQKAGLKEMQQAVADMQQWEDHTTQVMNESPSATASVASQKLNNRPSSLVSAAVRDIDPFSIFPPVPPPRKGSI